jgi:putative membrane protein
MQLKFAATAAALALTCAVAVAQDAKPNDAQIAHIAYTAGQIDIKAAELALQKSKNKDVRDFAENMARDHKAVNDQALALVKKLNVTPQDNDTSKALAKQAASKEAELKRLSGIAFDKAYADNEVAYHKTVNNALETVLIPDASNPELKDLLAAVLRPSRRQGRAPLPSGHCDDHCPRCRSGSGACCAEASRSAGPVDADCRTQSRGRTGAPSLEFCEGVGPQFSGVTVTGSGHQEVLAADRQVVLARRLHRRAVSVDSHHTQGTFQFTVR